MGREDKALEHEFARIRGDICNEREHGKCLAQAVVEFGLEFAELKREFAESRLEVAELKRRVAELEGNH